MERKDVSVPVSNTSVPTYSLTPSGSHKILKDLFSKEETNSRSNPIIIKTVRKARNNLTGMEGVIWGEGKTHHEQRKFMLTTLRDFGFGKSDMENLINDEVTGAKFWCTFSNGRLVSYPATNPICVSS